MLIDLLFDVAAGELVEPNWSYEIQLDYYRKQILPNYKSLSELLTYGQAYKTSSRLMFPGNPKKIRSRSYLIKLFTNYVLLKEIAECNDYALASAPSEITKVVRDKIQPASEEDRKVYNNELWYLAKQYAETLTEDDYKVFIAAMAGVSKAFEQACQTVVKFVMEGKSPLAALMEAYQIPQSDAVRFHLEIDTIVEISMVKNQYLAYMDEVRAEWEKGLPKYRFGTAAEEYIRAEKRPYIISYGGNINLINTERQLCAMLADVAVKLALAEGVGDYTELTRKMDSLTSELGNSMKDLFKATREPIIRKYHLTQRTSYSAELASVFIPYRTDLMYLKGIIMEEIRCRNAENVIQKQENKTRDEYELLLSQKDAEIYDLKRDLEYYENMKQQEFKAEVSQYNKALTDLFQKMCDVRYHSPLNELYLMANGLRELNPEDVRGILQNLIFILSTMNIVPYETGNVGKKVKFYNEEANIVYAVDDRKVKEGLNQGIQKYPGWKYKDAELVLPKVEIEED